jgi:hypothetical protein
LPPFTVRGRLSEPRGLDYRIESQDTPLPEAALRDVLERARAGWSATGVVRVAGTAGEADFVFSWARAQSPTNPDGRFGRDTSVAATGPMGPACQVVFDADRTWSEAPGSGLSLHQAAVHEIGHVLGLGHTEDPTAVLHAQRENGRTLLAPADLAGLHSLYGGGSDGPGDLVIDAERPVPALRRVAPPGASDWTLFDTDGDGDDEILVWATGARAAGVLTVYHFSRGPLLERSTGPHLGIGGYGARLFVGRTADGERCIDVSWPDSAVSRWSFGSDGVPGARRPIPADELLACSAGEHADATGDLDGDGQPERVRRVP